MNEQEPIYPLYPDYPGYLPESEERFFPFPNMPGQQFGPPSSPPGMPGPDMSNHGQFPGWGPPSQHGGPHDGQQGQQAGPPNTPPPSFVPQQTHFQTFAVDPGAIRMCRFRFTYVWLHNQSFWFYPTFIGRNSIAGFRWRHNRWVYFGIDLNQIVSFQCF
ncbi:hypothetical protein ACFSMW_12505 [Virgibacillus halophilus]|uniref:Transporter n=1 Tax=Tigheibacillus halophilus TaxID=361280 RepID=A0ABU5C7E6_9BACI|nr:hypothetical protein [Virgibacillus halophilus]